MLLSNVCLVLRRKKYDFTTVVYSVLSPEISRFHVSGVFPSDQLSVPCNDNATHHELQFLFHPQQQQRGAWAKVLLLVVEQGLLLFLSLFKKQSLYSFFSSIAV